MATTLSAQQLFEFALKQMAAECDLEGNPSGDDLVIRLARGANPIAMSFDPFVDSLPSKTRMTTQQADRFTASFRIVDHRSNDDENHDVSSQDAFRALNGSGLSATLFQDINGGAFTLSIRSTEYADTASGGDWDRDGLPGADGQLISTGYALAQLAALEQYYEWLATAGHLASGTKLTVTGYSLGAHLATAFTLMHPDIVTQAVTFNGPGVGANLDGTGIAAAVARYRELLANPALTDGGDDAERTLRANAIALCDAGVALEQTSIYHDPRHAWADKVVKAEFGTYFNAFGKDDESLGDKIVQLVGHAAYGDYELTANTGHHAPETRVFIEDQPDITGLGVKLAEKVLGLKSDFGATHSITLIADSLAAMELFQKLEPSLSLDQLFEIFAAASNERSVGFIGTQGVAEGNSLESIAQALRKLYTGDDTRLTYDPQGGGFGNRTNRNAYYAALDAASAAIDVGIDRLTSLAPGLNATLDAQSLASRAKTEDGMATRFALLNLQPFVIDGADAARRAALFDRHNDAHQLDLADGTAPGGLMTPQYIDDRSEFLRRVLHYNRADLAYTQTAAPPPDAAPPSDPFYWEDIVWSDATRGILVQRGPTTASTRYVRFGSDAAESGTTALVGGSRRDSLYGMAGNDELRGFAGDDYLEGGLGDDRIEGGSGRDTLRGGPGADTFVISSGDGNDTIVDADASDALVWDGVRLIEGRQVLGNNFASTSTGDLRFRYSLVPNDHGGMDLRITRDESADSVTVKNWEKPPSATTGSAPASLSMSADAQGPLLGIQLDAAAPPSPPNPSAAIGGTTGDDTIFDTALGELIDTGAGNDGISAINGGRDLIRAGSGDDFVFTGDADADWIELGIGRDVGLGSLADDDIFGDAGEDRLDGGIGDDRLDGGDGADLIGGGGGANIVRAGAGNDYVWTGRRTIGAAGTTPLPGHVVLAQGRDWIVQAPLSGGVLGKPVIPVYGQENEDAEANIAYGDEGDDRLWGDTGADILDGGADNDVLVGMQAADLLIGGLGDDLLYGDGTRMGSGALDALPDVSHGEDALFGGDGNDQLYGQGASDELHGGAGADFLRGDLSHEPELSRTVAQGDDLIEGGIGNDQMIGDGGNDLMAGDDGDDILYGDALIAELSADQHGNDRLDGGAGSDQLVGFGGHDTILAGDGNDLVWADGAANIAVDGSYHGNDTVDAGDGDDYAEGGGGNDSVFGGQGVDRLYGDAGDDDLGGGDQDDQLSGGDGADRLLGGRGVDYLSGGSGADTYVLSQADSLVINGQADTITDSADGNVIEFGDGTTPADLVAQLNGDDLVLRFGSSAAYVVGGAAGTIGTLRFADGSEISIERFLGERQPVAVLRTVASNQQALGGAAVDVLTVAAGASHVVVSTGRGDETVSVGADAQGVTLRFNLGDGHDRVTFAASSNVATRAPHVVELGAEIHPDEAWLSWRHTSANRGELTLHYSGDDQVTIGDVAVDAVRQDAKFDLLRFADGTTLGWNALLDRGVRIELAGGSDPATGTPLDDTLVGDATSRTLRGGDGDDRIVLGRGTETALGQAGSDTVQYGRGDGHDTIDNRDGVAGDVDTLALESSLAPSEVRFLRQGDDLLAQIVDSPDDRATVRGFFVNPAVERVAFGDGTTFDRTDLPLATPASQATAGNDMIYLIDTGAAADALAGDDQVFGGLGADRLRGGAGDDRLLGSAGSDIYEIAAGDGHDRIEDRGAAVDLDVLRFDAGISRNELIFEGTAAGSLLIHRGGLQSIEVIDQFAANTPSHGLERIEFADGAVMTRSDIAAAAGGATPGSDVLRGTAGADIIDGLGGDDRIYGEAGNDTLIGGDGNDTLYDGPGADVLRGGAGNDSLYASSDAPDQLYGGSGDDTYFDVDPTDVIVELAGEGNDRIQTSWSVDLGGATVGGMVSGAGLAQVEYATIAPGATASAYGNALGNTLVGNEQGNTLEGRDGNDHLSTGGGTGNEVGGTIDVLRGGNGDDTLDAAYHVGGRIVLEGGAGNDRYLLPVTDGFAGAVAVTVTETANGGVDTLVSGLLAYTLPANIENLFIAPQGRVGFSGINYNLDGVGNALDNILVGNTGNNRLSGGAGNDTIHGDAGDDTLDGMTGNDVLYGGAGNDIYRLNDDATDSIVEVANEGFDTVVSAFSYTLAANLERLDLATSKKQLDGNGNALDNVINGNSGANVLSGIGGNDTISGREGTDILLGGDGNDLLYGDAGSDTLDGGIGDDRLDGGAGNDKLDGGAGNDVYVVDSARDTVTELAGAGIDRIESTVTVALAAQVENLTLLGSSAINGTGNASANVIVGNAGNNTLAGAGGADIYIGGIGNDSINTGDGAAERICFARGHGNDTVTGSGNAGEDRLELSGGIAGTSVVLRRSSNNLVVDLGAGESVSVTNYYAGARNVGTLRLIADSNWAPGQDGTPAAFADFSVAALAGGLTNGASVGLPAATGMAGGMAGGMDASGLTVEVSEPLTVAVAPVLPQPADRQDSNVLTSSVEAWWRDETVARGTAAVTAAQFAEAINGPAFIDGSIIAAPRPGGFDVPHLAPLLRSLDVQGSSDALPRAAIRGAWDRIVVHASDATDVGEMLGGEPASGSELLQSGAVVAPAMPEPKAQRMTWWRGVHR